jgi:hypothetical protein
MGNSTENKKASLTYGQYGYFTAVVWPKDRLIDQRYGQAFFNYFHEWMNVDTWPELFFEESTEKAKQLIEDNVEFNEG